MSGLYFVHRVRNGIHECAPDHSVDSIAVGTLRRAADDMERLYDALQEASKGQWTWGLHRKVERALKMAREAGE